MQQLGSGSDHCFFKDRLHLQIKELSVVGLYFEVFEIKYTFFTFQLAESGQCMGNRDVNAWIFMVSFASLQHRRKR